jgi:hypothetical protein
VQDDNLALILGETGQCAPQIQFSGVITVGRVELDGPFVEYDVALLNFRIVQDRVAHGGEQICLHIRDLPQVPAFEHSQENLVNRVLSACAVACDRPGEEQQHPPMLLIEQLNFGVVGASLHVEVSRV